MAKSKLPPKGKKLSLKEMREQSEMERLAFETKTLKLQQEMLEYYYDNPWNALGGRASRDDGLSTGLVPVHQLDRRQYDTVGSYFTTVDDLFAMVAQARVLHEDNPFAKNIVASRRNYILGDGMTCLVSDRDMDNVNKELVETIQGFVEASYELNDYYEYQEDTFETTSIEGENTTRFFFQEDGTTLIRPVYFEMIRPRKDMVDDAKWSWGVRHGVNKELQDLNGKKTYVESLDWETNLPRYKDKKVLREVHDRNSVVAYGIEYDVEGDEWEAVPAYEIERTKVNVPRLTKRGLSDFWAIGKNLEEVSKLVRNLRLGAAIQASIMGFVEYATAGQSTVENLVAEQRERLSRTQPGYGGVVRETSHVRAIPGVFKHLGQGQVYKPPPFWSQNSLNHVALVNASLRSCGIAFQLPEYMITGSAENANYASTLVAGSPLIKECVRWQGYYKRHFLCITWKIVKHAFDMGVFSKFGIPDWETFRKLVRIEIFAPPPEIRAAIEDAQIDDIDIQNGVMSKKTRRMRRNLNEEVEKKNIKEEKEAEQQDALDHQKKMQDAGIQPGVQPGTPSANGKPAQDRLKQRQNVDDKHMTNKPAQE